MSIATLRPKGQITIPADILQLWNLKPYDQVEININNGVVMLIPTSRKESSTPKSLLNFAGVGRGCWGDLTQDVEKNITELRDSWTK